MKHLLFLLLVFTIVHCQTPINAAYYVGSGFDSKKGVFGLNPIFDLTYTNKNTITLSNNVTYLCPDQMALVPYDMLSEIVFEGNYSYYNEYLYNYEAWFNFDINLGKSAFSLGFNYSKELGSVNDALSQGYSAVLHGYHALSYYKATLYPAYVLQYNPMFQLAINNLPQIIVTSADYDMYYAFVQAFGTHYLSASVFGGKVVYNTAVTDSITEKYQSSWEIEQFSFSFHSALFNISSGGFSNRSSINISEAFTLNSNSNAFFVGGDPALADVANLTNWMQSVADNAAPLNSSLIEIASLITDSVKATTFRNFITSYLTDNYYYDIFMKKKSLVNYPGQGCIGAGFDTTTMSGCLLPIFSFTYDNGTYPDQIVVQSTPETQLINVNVTMTDTFNINAYSVYSYKSSYGFLGMGTKTKTVYDFYSEYYDNAKSLSSNWITIAYQTVTLPLLPMPKLNPLFVQYLNMLPAYDAANITTQNLYFTFFKTFGTAFADQVILGGKFQFDLWYGNEFLNTYSYQQITESCHWSFLGIIGSGHGHSTTIENVSQNFIDTLEYDYEYLGGNITLGVNDWDIWVDSVQDDMAIIQYHLQPITMLINDYELQKNMLLAFNDYAQQAIVELETYVNNLQQGYRY